MRTLRTWLVVGAFLGSIILANWAVDTFGVIPIGFGLLAPAGVFVVGVTLALRDEVHELIGAKGAALAVLAGAGVSALFSPTLALASATAFLVSEMADLLVYIPIRRRTRVGALLASNTVGLTLDSIIFLSIAFGGLEFLPGQIVGKLYATIAAALFVAWRVRRENRQDHVPQMAQ